jgi:hypothetical protein
MSRGAGRGNVIIDSLPETYHISDIDNGGDPGYLGFLRPNGEWYIIQITADADFRYAKGESDYGTNWTGRVGLTYELYSNTF